MAKKKTTVKTARTWCHSCAEETVALVRVTPEYFEKNMSIDTRYFRAYHIPSWYQPEAMPLAMPDGSVQMVPLTAEEIKANIPGPAAFDPYVLQTLKRMVNERNGAYGHAWDAGWVCAHYICAETVRCMFTTPVEDEDTNNKLVAITGYAWGHDSATWKALLSNARKSLRRIANQGHAIPMTEQSPTICGRMVGEADYWTTPAHYDACAQRVKDKNKAEADLKAKMAMFQARVNALGWDKFEENYNTEPYTRTGDYEVKQDRRFCDEGVIKLSAAKFLELLDRAGL